MVSTAAEIRKYKDRLAVEVTLPSGLVILARRPAPLWFARHATLPTSLADKAVTGGVEDVNSAPMTSESLHSLAEYTVSLLKESLVSPRLSLDPNEPDTVTPEDLGEEDLKFLLRWIGGQVVSNDATKVASDLEEFRPKSAPVESGVSGGEVEGAPV